MTATLGPNENCQLWPKWQVLVCGSILIQTGSCHLGPVVAPNPVSQCAIARMATTGNCQSGPEWPKSAVYISLKIGYFELSHGYDITVTSHLGHWYLFQYVWKEETLAILWLMLHVSEGFIFLSSQ